jgi:hypothetical protein
MDMTDNVEVDSQAGQVDQLAEQLLDRADAEQAQLVGSDGSLTQLTSATASMTSDWTSH